MILEKYQAFGQEVKVIETLVKPQPLDNDIAVVKILQLMGQLSLSDIQYVLQVTHKVYGQVKPAKYTDEWCKEVEEFNKQLKAKNEQ